MIDGFERSAIADWGRPKVCSHVANLAPGKGFQLSIRFPAKFNINNLHRLNFAPWYHPFRPKPLSSTGQSLLLLVNNLVLDLIHQTFLVLLMPLMLLVDVGSAASASVVILIPGTWLT